MNAARFVPGIKDGTYLTANEGILVRLDRQSVLAAFEQYPDWVIYTDLQGTGSSSSSGTMKMVSQIELQWIQDKMPLLKEIDVLSLCGIVKEQPKSNLGKRLQPEQEE